MKTITKEERMLVFDDLIKYYQFCKTDRRNHIFNAINYGKKSLSEQERGKVKTAFKKAKASYSYYSRMKMVAILLKWNLVDFITQKEQIQAIDDAVFYYEWRIKTKKYHIQISEKKLEENKISDETLKRTLQNDKKEYDIYVKKLEIVNKLKDEVNSFT